MDWRFVEWLFAFGITGLLLACAWSFGGRGFARQFAFPILFLLLAVPWPTRLEHWLVQGLTGAVVKLAVEALRWLGVAAWSAGNVIHLPKTVVGVEDACSGVRALQGSLMCAIFFGEFWRLALSRRVLLIFAGFAAALILNFGRTLLLAWTAATNGTAAAERWHDSAGIGTLLACFGVTALAAWILRGRSENQTSSDAPRVRGSLSRLAVVGCVSWLVIVEVSARLWFRAHEKGLPQREFCDLALDAVSAQEQRIPPATQSILRYDSGSLHTSDSPNGSHWWIYRLNWKAGSIGTPLARYHSPEVCLPAAGIQFVEKRPDIHAGSQGSTRFQAAEYRWLAQPVYVFTNYESTQEKELIRRFDEFDLTWSKRLLAAAKGIRPGAQQVIEVVIAGPTSAQAAEGQFLEFARKAVRD
jgi:exosortase